MKRTFILLTIAVSLIIIPMLVSQPSFNGTSPGCSGSGCHTFSDGDVSVTLLDSITVEVTVSGTSNKVAGELVDISGNVVDVINSTNSNPFTLTAPVPGYYVINAGYKDPQRRWDSAAVNLIVPVELSSFIASVNEKDVILSWQTATELNNSGFDVERTEANEEWEKVGFVSGNGTSTEINSYTFADKDVPFGTYNYRIKQIDFDGTYEYFILEDEVEISSPGNFVLLQNYPNPFNPTTTIKYSVVEKTFVRLIIYDVAGSEVAVIVNKEQKAGEYEIDFNAGNLTSGVYFYRLQTGNFVETKKMILMK